MKNTKSIIAGLFLFFFLACIQTSIFSQHWLKITLDTKLMESFDYSLGGGGYVPGGSEGAPSTVDPVYAHIGLCTCNMTYDGTFHRICNDRASDSTYCFNQILPFRSNVWQHVVGNWGMDDGKGRMTTLGNGVYTIEFIIENYFSDPNLVNTAPATEQDPAHPVVNSSVWNPADGGYPFTIGMVFRNADGTISGRDSWGKDLFLINLYSTPKVIQGYEPNTPFYAITFATADVKEVDNSVHYLSVYPNPVIDETKIIFTLTDIVSQVSIKVYNLLGQEVSNVFEGKMTSGSHSAIWNARDNNGNYLPNGMYNCILKSNDRVIGNNKIIIGK